ncbi:DUF2069 domain-containing protein [Tahibacter amnicola]|uniref:DUF2069 domain-containing protein n=1 Tax=Tahibacter amnicola TaxID=2976241 RepID=A0ABY6BD56_9GAMM|nr:DUF2069 domain-containing protein [Tahibacter amnicola]UXI67462.1 DUF2069 domain-containing protein [Tahibacter amnicola]
MNAQRLGVWLWAALVALQFAWYLWLAPPPVASPWVSSLLAAGVLLLPVLALRSGVQRALLWVGLIALLYFMHGVVVAFSLPRSRLPAVLEVVLCVALIGVLGYAALRDKRTARASQAVAPPNLQRNSDVLRAAGRRTGQSVSR